MSSLRYIGFAFVVLIAVSTSHALECYRCINQEGNVEKCLNNPGICAPEEDACLTEIKWGSPPYWSQGAKKQYYVSKRCSTKRECEKIRRTNMPDCTYIWYQDWQCSECCQGDRCNYYIFSGSSDNYPRLLTIATITTLSLIMKIWW